MNRPSLLTDDERADIAALAKHYADPRSAGIDALVRVQTGRGWISDGVLADVAAQLGMTPTELDGIATFYNRIYRRPVGRHVIHACDSMVCRMMGGDVVWDALQDHLRVRPGGTTGDGRFTLLPIQCLGACDRAPVMLVGERLHANLDPTRLPQALDHHG